jgi:hypothetical protein
MAEILEGPDAERRVWRLGIPGTAILVDALGYGSAAARTVTAAHPLSYRGQRLWAEATAYLRMELPEPWEPEVIVGVDLVVNRQSGIAMIVTKGDGATGQRQHTPQVHYERGEVIQRLVNGSLDTLFTVGQRPEWEVWFLLHRLQADACAAELARPAALDRQGAVVSWVTRLLLPGTARAPRGRIAVPAPSSPTADVDVPVRRRTG